MLIFIFLFNSIVFGAQNINVCEHFEKFVSQGVPKTPLQQALTFFKENENQLNQKTILIADYSINSANKRFFILNLGNGEVIPLRVSHGSGKITLYKKAPTHEQSMYVERFNGEKSHNGDFFSCRISPEDLERVNKNRADFGMPPKHNQENLTRAGFFKLGPLYLSEHHRKSHRPSGRHHWWDLSESTNGIRLYGLTPEVNDLALQHGVVMHEATYNDKNAPIMGRSYGCPAFEKGELKKHLKYFSQNTLYYAFVPQCPEEMNKVLNQIQGYEALCTRAKTNPSE